LFSSEIGNLGSLLHLSLSNNQLNGEIPDEIGALISLNNLQLQDNNLTGPIPKEIGNLSNLIILWLFSNQLSGTLPVELGRLSNVTQLNLSSNQLTGTIPDSLWRLVNLLELQLNNNLFEGNLSPQIGNLTQLRRLQLQFNQLSGSIPVEIGDTMLFDLSLQNNTFDGTIPQSVANLTDMLMFDLSSNNFSGDVPTGITAFNQLQFCSIANNAFSGFPDLSGITTITDLNVQNNRLTFEDLEPNVGINNFTYTPQDNVGIAVDTTVATGTNLTFSVSVGGSSNVYQWLKDGIEVSGANQSSYSINNVTLSDSGLYQCRITNTIVSDLTLYSRGTAVSIETPSRVTTNSLPSHFALYQNYPNPFNPETTLSYDLPSQVDVQLFIFDALGRKVRTLVAEKQNPGSYNVLWDGRSDDGSVTASGLYFYRLVAGEFRRTAKMLLIK